MSTNWKAVVVWSAAIAAVVGLAACNGLSLDTIIPVDVPPEVQDVTGSPDRVTLRDVEYVREDYIVKFQRGLERLDENIADAEFWRGTAEMILNSGLEVAVPYLGTVPGGAILTLLLGGVAGKLMKRPGEDARVKAASDEAWDEAVRQTLTSIKEAKDASPTA